MAVTFTDEKKFKPWRRRANYWSVDWTKILPKTRAANGGGSKFKPGSPGSPQALVQLEFFQKHWKAQPSDLPRLHCPKEFPNEYLLQKFHIESSNSTFWSKSNDRNTHV